MQGADSVGGGVGVVLGVRIPPSLFLRLTHFKIRK